MGYYKMILLPAKLNAEPLFSEISNHAFNQALRAGTLPSTTFNRFLTQDKIYLSYYSDALRQATLCAPTEAIQDTLTSFRKDTLAYEAELYKTYYIPDTTLSFFQTPPEPIIEIKQYGEHLLAQDSYADQISALTPCFWLYASLGKTHPSESFSKDHPYLPWLETYTDPSFKVAAEQMVGLLEGCFNDAKTEDEHAKMSRIFFKSLEHELAFFDVSYSDLSNKSKLDTGMLNLGTL